MKISKSERFLVIALKRSGREISTEIPSKTPAIAPKDTRDKQIFVWEIFIANCWLGKPVVL